MSYAICLSYKVVQTRKPHRCYGCAKLFPTGSILAYQFLVDGGDTGSCYFCQDCDCWLREQTDPDAEYHYGEVRWLMQQEAEEAALQSTLTAAGGK